MKKYVVLIICSLTAVLFTSCDSLWNVTGGASVDFAIDFNEISRQLTNTNDSQANQRAVAPLVDGFDGIENVFVGIYDAKTDALIASETLSLLDAQQSNVSFNRLPVRKEVYALIRITIADDEGEDEGEDENENESQLLFRARSLDTSLKNGNNTLSCKPNLLFYNGNGISNLRNGDFLFPMPVSTQELLQGAYDYMSIDGEIIPDATILTLETIRVALTSVNEQETWDFPGLTLLRGSNSGAVVNVTRSGGSDPSLVLKNITIDGNGKNYISDSAALVLESTGAILDMYTGVTIKNNSNKSDLGGGIYNASTMNMYGGTITGNTSVSGGGIYLSGASVTEIHGGTITGNTAASAGGGIYWGVGEFGYTNIGGSIVVKDNVLQDNSRSNVCTVNPITIFKKITSGKGSIGVSVLSSSNESTAGTFAWPDYGDPTSGNSPPYIGIRDDMSAFFSDNPVYTVIDWSEDPLLEPELKLQ